MKPDQEHPKVDALVLTYRREQLATQVVEGLIEQEGMRTELLRFRLDRTPGFGARVR